MAQILVRDLHEDTVLALKRRAETHRRSLVQEVRLILEKETEGVETDPGAAAARIRKNLRARGISYSDSGNTQAEDRAR